MVIFDRLDISDSGKRLYIDIHVNKADYFDSMSLDRIVIQTAEQVSETDPLTPGSEYIYSQTIEGSERELHLSLDACADFDKVYSTLSDKLLFVYVICKGTPDACTPCRLDEMTTLGVTFDISLLYQKVMQYTREMGDECQIPKGMLDLIFLWNGFKAAVETEHYLPAIDFWRKMFDRHYRLNKNVNKPCGCHG